MSDYHGFGWAVKRLKEGNYVSREGWNGKGMYLFLIMSAKLDGGPAEVCQFIMMKTAQGDYVPWVASQSDILGEDWFVIEV